MADQKSCEQLAQHASKPSAGGAPASDRPMGGNSKPMPMTTNPTSTGPKGK